LADGQEAFEMVVVEAAMDVSEDSDLVSDCRVHWL
jgi:hypothetical protein